MFVVVLLGRAQLIAVFLPQMSWLVLRSYFSIQIKLSCQL